MTSKEKAQELFDKYYIICQEYTEEIQCSIQAKQCALIAVDEIIRELTEEISPSVHGFRHQYWIEVEHELNNL